MENPWRAPVVAVEDGTVKYWDSGLGGCMLYLYGRSGTTYMYIHLNNDLTARNDNKGGCVKGVTFAVPNGARVTAGQQIAWNGDSGDASGNPHLHFEVHPNGGADVNPFQAPQARSQAAVRGARGSRVQPRAAWQARRRGRRRGDARRRPRPPVSRAAAGSTSTSARSSSPSRSEPTGGLLDQLAGMTRRRLKNPTDVTAYTLKANATPDAILGAPGALLLGRVTTTSR